MLFAGLQEVLNVAKCIDDIHQELPNSCVFIMKFEGGKKMRKILIFSSQECCVFENYMLRFCVIKRWKFSRKNNFGEKRKWIIRETYIALISTEWSVLLIHSLAKYLVLFILNKILIFSFNINVHILSVINECACMVHYWNDSDMGKYPFKQTPLILNFISTNSKGNLWR